MLHQTRSTRFGKQSTSCLQVTASCLLKIKIKSKATSIFIKTWSLEGLPTKAKEDPSPHEMRLSPVGHQPSISWSPGYYYILSLLSLLLWLLLLLLLLLNMGEIKTIEFQLNISIFKSFQRSLPPLWSTHHY